MRLDPPLRSATTGHEVLAFAHYLVPAEGIPPLQAGPMHGRSPPVAVAPRRAFAPVVDVARQEFPDATRSEPRLSHPRRQRRAGIYLADSDGALDGCVRVRHLRLC